MKQMYWQPVHISRVKLVAIAMVACAAYIACELLPIQAKQPFFHEKKLASTLAQRGFDAIKAERIRRKEPFDKEADPLQTGLVGTLNSKVTTNAGELRAKRTSINANFAAVMVQWMHEAGVNKGDTVAVGMSGSFPALNIATLAALETMDIRPLVIASASGSQWGANDPNFLWLDMQQLLRDKHVLATAPIAVSRGGIKDRAIGLSDEGQSLLDEAMARSGWPVLTAQDYQDSLTERMRLFEDAAAGAPIKAYINVGGGTVSVGTHIGKSLFRPGLNLHVEDDRPIFDSVMQTFATQSIAVVHVTQVQHVARDYGLPIDPTVVPKPGEGLIFVRPAYSPQVAGIGLVLILMTMLFCSRGRIGHSH
jgi:poly-gamma-glutamate system protein